MQGCEWAGTAFWLEFLQPEVTPFLFCINLLPKCHPANWTKIGVSVQLSLAFHFVRLINWSPFLTGSFRHIQMEV